jgi:hypothetical protein
MWRLTHVGSTLPESLVLDGVELSKGRGRDAISNISEAIGDNQTAAWIAILDPECDRKSVLSNLFALTLFEQRVVAAGGIVCDEKGEVVKWSGGLFASNKTVFDPYLDHPLGDSGYHGQLYCQRCVDVLAPINLLIRKETVHEVLKKFEFSRFESFTVALGIEAALSGSLVAVTPHVRFSAPSISNIQLPDDREGLLERAVIDARCLGRWYSHLMPAFSDRAFTIAPDKLHEEPYLAEDSAPVHRVTRDTKQRAFP